MEIAGIEKFSLVDYPEEICCVLFLKGCNFHCGFCYNPQLVIPQKTLQIPKEEILEFLDKRKGKLTGVCITGGEPLLTIEEEFLKEIKKRDYKIKIDTNGTNPEKLKKLISEKLVDYIAMDLKGPKELYSEITQVPVEIEKIERSIKLISEFPNHEFRTTILQKFHSKENLASMVQWVKGIIGGNPRALYVQAFKNTDNLLDSEFHKEKNTTEEYLEELTKLGEFIKTR